ncbi:peptide ABC transporter substrate-binding protein [Deinococcus sp.]|uniref:peptide ABC transporter substrate-binding protein n=1 Tax=Deinococcus sp. TaxID=47478 RepID=UPI003B5B8A55
MQGANTFTITFEPPYLFADSFSPNNGGAAAPAHVMQAAWNAFDAATKTLDPAKDAKPINDEWNKFLAQFTTARGLPKVVSGAFKPTSWRSGNSLVMTRNPNYWLAPKGGADKYLQTVQYRFITDTNTLKVNVLSGQVDALSGVSLTFDQALDLQKSERGKYKVYFVPGATWEHIDIANTGARAKSLGLDDPRVRQALLLGIDRAALTKALFQGKQAVAGSWVSPVGELYKKDIKGYAFDAAKAKELFAAAGWKPGADGILAKNGTKMTLNFTTTAGNAVRERVQQILQAQWKQVGVDVKIQNFPATVVFSNDFAARSSEGKWDMFMYAWTNDPSQERGDLWASENIPAQANGFAGQNYPNYKNAEYDKLWTQAKTEFDLAARAKLFAKMQDIWAGDLPALPLYFRVNPYTKVPGLVNYTYSAFTLYPSWNAAQIGWASRGAAETYTQK